MSQSYKVIAKKMNMGDRKGDVVYTVRPVSYGTLTTDDAARQISEESAVTVGDVKDVLDRYAYYVKENLKKGYNIELLGFGKLFIRFLTDKAVNEEKKATAKLIKNLIPAFRPSFKLLANGTRKYDLIPDKIALVKYGEDGKESETADSKASTGGTADDSGSGDSGNAGSGSSDSGNSGSDSSSDSGSTGSDSGSDSGSTSGGLTDDNG